LLSPSVEPKGGFAADSREIPRSEKAASAKEEIAKNEIVKFLVDWLLRVVMR
jgi:hypothetical protein